MCPFCGRRKGGLVCGYCGWVPSLKCIDEVIASLKFQENNYE